MISFENISNTFAIRFNDKMKILDFSHYKKDRIFDVIENLIMNMKI